MGGSSDSQWRRWSGRSIRLAVVLVAAAAGTVLGALSYLDLTEGPFVSAGSDRLVQAGYDAADCYWSPEAGQVTERQQRLLLVLPVGQVLLVAGGGAVAVLWNRSRPATPAVGGPTAAVDAVVAGVGILVLAGVAFTAAHGYDIGQLLDPGCVRAPVAGRAMMLGAVAATAGGTEAIGFWLERRSQRRRLGRQVD